MMKKTVLVMLVVVVAGLVAKPIRFAVIGDRTGEHQDSVYKRIVAEVVQAKPELVVTVGDQIEGYTEDTAELNQQWQEYRSLVAPLTVPLRLVPGNHDITSDAMQPFYERYAGKPYYSFDYKGMHFVVLDASRWWASDKLPAEQLDWLTADLGTTRKARFTFVFLHKPFWDGTVTGGKPDTLHKLFVKYGVDAVFAGHYHQYFSGTYDGIKYTVLGSSGGGTEPGPTGIEYHWTMVTVDDKQGIVVEPILPGGERRQWDDVTVGDMRSIGRNELRGLRFSRPVVVKPDLSADGRVTLTVENLSATEPVHDSLRWDIPAGWSIEPAAALLHAEPGGTASVELAARCAGRPFPAPVAYLRLPYAPGKTSAVKRTLHAARTATCYRAERPPVLDGVVSDKCWKNPVSRLLSADGGPAQTDSTRFYFAYDKDNVYLAAVCFDPAVNTVTAQAQERDGAVYNDDCIGYFFQPETGKATVYQLYFNPKGVSFDQEIKVGEQGEVNTDPKFDGVYDARTYLGDGFWSIEVRIPRLGRDYVVGPGSVLGCNFRRKQPGRKANADWQPISYDPKTFGLLLAE